VIERECIEDNEDEIGFHMYPTLDDPKFNLKIAEKEEFVENSYDGQLQEKIEDYAKKLAGTRFEVAPYQAFIKNFLSPETPYKSALLYHGLGTGKTCSALAVTEENRRFQKSNNAEAKTIIVASDIILENFKSQLMSKDRLKEEGGVITMDSCVGEDLLKEINPSQLLNVNRDYIATQLESIVKESYEFLNYDELNQRILDPKSSFNNTFVVIDEVHNIRKYEENRYQELAKNLEKMASSATNLRFLFLSATPIFNSPQEIVYLINLLNAADRRAQMKVGDVFDEEGNFVTKAKEETPDMPFGEELLLQKATGYVSFVKGENPYTFPYRIYPKYFAKENTFIQNEDGKFLYHPYPRKQIGGLSVYTETVYVKKSSPNLFLAIIPKTSNQGEIYNYLVSQKLKNLQLPLQSLNMTYPFAFDKTKPGKGIIAYFTSFFSGSKVKPNAEELTGRKGLARVMSFVDTKDPPAKGGFEYKIEEPIFAPENIGKYSAKIKNIVDTVQTAKGIILIYSQYIESGLIPVALALEELGFSRYENKSLFAKPRKEEDPTKKYILVTADKRLSPNNAQDVEIASSDENRDGNVVKIILISKEGAEGVDLKNIRQVHILEPAESSNTIEQVIGRAVRNFSHKDLPFIERNVQIYMYGSLIERYPDVEPVDLFFYRRAGNRAVEMGKVTRLLKQTAVDCIVHHDQTNFAQEILQEKIEGVVKQELASGQTINDFPVGDEPFSAVCDYMSSCYYDCVPDGDKKDIPTNTDTYNSSFMFTNTEKIIQTLRQMIKTEYFFEKDELYKALGAYTPIEIFASLTEMIRSHILLTDMYGRPGYLVNVGDYYFFQPQEVSQPDISLEERKNPVPQTPLKLDLFEEDINLIETPEVGSAATLDKMRENYAVALESFQRDVTDVGLKDPYYITLGKMARLAKLQESELLFLSVSHNIESLNFDEKLALLQVMAKTDDDIGAVEDQVKLYFLEHAEIDSSGNEIIALLDDDEIQVYKLNAKKMQFELIEERYSPPRKKLASLVGYLGYEKRHNYALEFHTIEPTKARGKRSSCSLQSKTKTIQKLQMMEVRVKNLDLYNTDELCVLLEISLRQKKNDLKTWFVTPEEAVLYGF
jgi:superfamily II DNA or RNA helicase